MHICTCLTWGSLFREVMDFVIWSVSTQVLDFTCLFSLGYSVRSSTHSFLEPLPLKSCSMTGIVGIGLVPYCLGSRHLNYYSTSLPVLKILHNLILVYDCWCATIMSECDWWWVTILEWILVYDCCDESPVLWVWLVMCYHCGVNSGIDCDSFSTLAVTWYHHIWF